MEQNLFTKEIQEISARVEALQAAGKCPVVIGIDGMAASGKTTVTALLEQALDAAVIHMDDFFLPQGFRTPQRLKTPGGNVYYERFKQEVVPYLRCGDLFGYRVFDAHQHEYTGTRVIAPKPVIIVEGSYCMHPELGDIYDLRIFSKVSPDEQMQRIKQTVPVLRTCTRLCGFPWKTAIMQLSISKPNVIWSLQAVRLRVSRLWRLNGSF